MSKKQARLDGSGHRYIKLQTKLSISFSVLAILTSALLTVALYMTVRGQLRENIRERLRNIASVAALQIDGDAHAALTDSAQEGNAAYMKIKRVLQRIRDNSPDIRFIYTWRSNDAGQLIFVVDAETDPNEISHLGDVYHSDNTPFFQQQLVSLKGPLADEEFTTDEWGIWLSGYAPFYRSDGRREGIIGLDISAADVIAHERQFLWVALAVFGTTIPIALILGWLLGRKLAAPIVKLTQGSERIAQGDLNHRVLLTSNDETGILAAAFNNMTKSLQSVIIAREQEITMRKQAEENIKVLKQQIEFILGATKTGIDIIDSEYNIRYIDPEWQKIYGDTSGKKCYEYFMGRTEICPDCGIIKAFKTKTITVTEEILVKENNRPVQVTTIPFQNNNGEWLVAEVNVDITERKRAEKDLEALNKELESTVENLSEANQQLRDFAHIAAHDLKAPLRAIGTLADWLSIDYADKFDEAGLEKVKLITKRAERMNRLINAILQYSGVGRVTEEKEMINLNAVVDEAIFAIEPPDNIEITIENELPVVMCDQTSMIQVFRNLISNAVKYMDKPKGHIRIGCVEKKDCWQFSVADNGPGIEEKYFEKIFKIFQTLLPRDKFESVGIGLSLVKKIVEMHGGKVWVESEQGQGSIFFFTLPKQEIGVKDAKLEAYIVS